MRLEGTGLCFALLGCSAPQGSNADGGYAPADGAPSGFGGTLDATVDAGAPDAPGIGLSYGPDPLPEGCDGGIFGGQCAPPPPVCIDARYAVLYQNGTCTSGACSWKKYDADCSKYDGGTCVGGDSDGGLASSGDGGLWASFDGCLVPLGPLPAPPAVACDDDASADAATCAPPPPFCASAGGRRSWLLYYDNGACGSGQCAWQLVSLACPFDCRDGACVLPMGT
jgi:hypothetical protein